MNKENECIKKNKYNLNVTLKNIENDIQKFYIKIFSNDSKNCSYELDELYISYKNIIKELENTKKLLILIIHKLKKYYKE